MGTVTNLQQATPGRFAGDCAKMVSGAYYITFFFYRRHLETWYQNSWGGGSITREGALVRVVLKRGRKNDRDESMRCCRYDGSKNGKILPDPYHLQHRITDRLSQKCHHQGLSKLERPPRSSTAETSCKMHFNTSLDCLVNSILC